MPIDSTVDELIREEAQKLGLTVVSIKQHYEAIDDLVSVVLLGTNASAEAIAKLEEATNSLESQVIVVEKRD